ncbi:hypothetical protein D3C76_1007090 [compost metagenome]|uniref:Membrane-bound lysozyme-inhibitor of c-type lysozyme n=1 Tax=Pseudomonas jinjuensis TaxID=198616 RepID=A0A1H0KR69_9PSED|nr:hypothetical protein [Pseudomonas jinjuensis]SDO58457.1 hypothetical protein SAMN05216193_11330 [Pseudomonas jinjuensis]
MYRPFLVAILLTASAAAHAEGLPLLDYDCPGNIAVHAEGESVFVNGKEAKVKKFNDKYYEARGGGVTISISLEDDGTATVSYTGKGGANGVCSSSEAEE